MTHDRAKMPRGTYYYWGKGDADEAVANWRLWMETVEGLLPPERLPREVGTWSHLPARVLDLGVLNQDVGTAFGRLQASIDAAGPRSPRLYRDEATNRIYLVFPWKNEA